MRRSVLILALAASLGAFAVPQLKPQAELVADGEFKAKVLAGAAGIPAPTPEARFYVRVAGTERTELKFHSALDLWRLRAFAGEWKDRKGNVMRLARVLSVPPAPRDADRGEIEAELDGLGKAFGGTDAELADWLAAWGESDAGDFFTLKGRRYRVDFGFAEPVKPADAQKLLKAFLKSVSAIVSGGGNNSSMKWWESSNPQYRFLTDLDRAKGGKFIRDAMRKMEAMRKAYEAAVPPSKPVGVCTVRVFRSLAGYRDYRASTGEIDLMSCGLWDPSREELLIAAENPKEAQDTMRHEAFHQYLHYATGNGRHATWFNEGMACYFENVEYNSGKNTVKVVGKGGRADAVAADPALFARSIVPVLAMSRDQFYSGDVGRHYCTAWAICWFLEKGAFTSPDFEPYRGIVPKYLELTAQGMPAELATRAAWAAVAGRDVAADFLKFWQEKRKLVK